MDYQKLIKKIQKEKNNLIKRVVFINFDYNNICKKYYNIQNDPNNYCEDLLKTKMKEILHDNESIPINNKWIKVINYYKYDEALPIEYTIDNELINKMKKYNNYYKIYVSKGYDLSKLYKYNATQYLKFFIVFDPSDKKNFVIFYTSYSVLNALKTNISIYLGEEKITNLNKFLNLNGLSVKLLGIYRGITSKNIPEVKNIKNDLVMEFINNNNIKIEIEKEKNLIKSNKISHNGSTLIINLNTNQNIKKLIESYKGLSYNNIIFKTFDNINVTTQIPFKLQNIDKKFFEPSYGSQYGKIYLIYDKEYKHFYFGSTMDPMSIRLCNHKQTISNNERYYAKIINTLGVNNFFCIIVEYIDTLDLEELRKRENYYIKKYDAKNKNIGGMNIVDADFLTRNHLIRKSFAKKHFKNK